MSGYITQVILQSLATALPLLIVWIVGLVLAVVRLKNDTKSGIFTLLGIPIIGLAFLLELAWNIFGIRWINTNPRAWQMARTLMIVAPLIISLIRAGGWACILLAIFSRPKKQPELPPETEEHTES